MEESTTDLAEPQGTRTLVAGAAQVVVGALLLGATLGYVASAGWEFWKNREMCACANVGLVDDETAGVDRSTRDELQRGFSASTLAGAAVGLAAGVAAWLVTVRRTRRMSAVLAGPAAGDAPPDPAPGAGPERTLGPPLPPRPPDDSAARCDDGRRDPR